GRPPVPFRLDRRAASVASAAAAGIAAAADGALARGAGMVLEAGLAGSVVVDHRPPREVLALPRFDGAAAAEGPDAEHTGEDQNSFSHGALPYQQTGTLDHRLEGSARQRPQGVGRTDDAGQRRPEGVVGLDEDLAESLAAEDLVAEGSEER